MQAFLQQLEGNTCAAEARHNPQRGLVGAKNTSGAKDAFAAQLLVTRLSPTRTADSGQVDAVVAQLDLALQTHGVHLKLTRYGRQRAACRSRCVTYCMTDCQPQCVT